MRLGGVSDEPQAQLDGFKSRTLRDEAVAQRLLYVTEWRSFDVVEARGGATLMTSIEPLPVQKECLPLQTSGHELAGVTGYRSASLSIVMTVEMWGVQLLLSVLELVLAFVQEQAAVTSTPAVWLLTVGNAEHAGLWGIGRSARAEVPLPLACIHAPVPMALAVGLMRTEPEMMLHSAAFLVPRLASGRRTAANATTLPAAGAQLITGGTAGLGLRTARWLASLGTHTLTLASRTGMLVRKLAGGEWKQMCAANMSVLVQRCDTAEGTDVTRLLARFTGARGVWHAAGVLADRVLPKQTAQGLVCVCAPKAQGAWVMHRACAFAVVLTHVLFSSAAALLGGAGQANYSAANACLDALASCWRTCAQAATSVQWGAWAEVGMASRGAAAKRMAVMEADAELGRIDLAQGLSALHIALLPQVPSLLGVIPLRLERVLRRGAVSALLSSMMAVSTMVECASTPTVDQPVTSAISLEAVLSLVRRTAGSTIDADAPLMEAGVDSLGAVELRSQLQRTVGDRMSLPSTIVFDQPTARCLTMIIIKDCNIDFPTPSAVLIGGTTFRGSNVRIAGCDAAYPAASSSLARIWRMFSGCYDAVIAVPPSRMTLVLPDEELDLGLLHECDKFDSAMFRCSQAEAAVMDPQHRLLCEYGYSALNSAGFRRADLAGSKAASFLGMWPSDFDAVLRQRAETSVLLATAGGCSIAAGRLSYLLGLNGPCIAIDTASSSALAACSLAVHSLQSGDCGPVANVQGSHLMFHPDTAATMRNVGLLKPSGRCYTWDARADGIVFGEACLAVTLSFLLTFASLSVISVQGVTVRQDGRTAVLTAPNGSAQQLLYRDSLRVAGTTEQELSICALHGTGTQLGDPVEAGSLSAVVLKAANSDCAVTGIKANTGHTGAAGGLAALLIMALNSLQSKAHPHAQLRLMSTPVHHVLKASKACVPVAVTSIIPSLPGHVTGGVNSFGWNGTIVHGVLFADHASILDKPRMPQRLAFRRLAFAVGPAVSRLAAASTLQNSVEGSRSAHSQVEEAPHAVSVEEVVNIVCKLTASNSSEIDADAPLMDAGIGSLGATELASELRELTGLALSSTIAFEQPTPRAVAAYLLEQATSVRARAPPSFKTGVISTACACSCVANKPVPIGIKGYWLGGCGGDVAQLHAACCDALSDLARAWWVVEKSLNGRELGATLAARVYHNDFVLSSQCFDTCTSGLGVEGKRWHSASRSRLLRSYRRRAFLWREMASAFSVDSMCTYSVCWARAPFIVNVPAPLWLLLACTDAQREAASPTALHVFTVLLYANVTSAAPSLHGMRLALALAQRLEVRKTAPPRLLVITSGVLTSGGGGVASNAAHGGVWGFARVLRLEHPALRTQSAGVSTCASAVTTAALTDPSEEGEAAWRAITCFVARLRACEAPSFKGALLPCGMFALTGGLGGLGVRAATLLVDRGAYVVLLASRSGRVARNEHGLEAQLQLKSSEAAAVACDSADAWDMSALPSLGSLAGLLHAAGSGDRSLLVELEARPLQWMHASKTIGAWHLQCASSSMPLCARVLFSSVGSGLGNVGQANYAAANACLDAHASSQRGRGASICSIQWPLVNGAGMGAPAFAAIGERQIAIAGFAVISLEEYAACLWSHLVGNGSAALSVQMVHRSDARRLLQDVADVTQSRFGELMAHATERGRFESVMLIANPSLSSTLGKIVISRIPSQRHGHIEAFVLRAVRELTGTPFVALTADTALMEVEVDSLAATELASHLRSHTGVALSPTLVFDQPTPRAIAAHLLGQLTYESSEAGPATTHRVCTGALLHRSALIGWWPYCSEGGVAQPQAPVMCNDVSGRVPRTQWALNETEDTLVLSAAHAARVVHGDFVLGAQRLGLHSFECFAFVWGADPPGGRVGALPKASVPLSDASVSDSQLSDLPRSSTRRGNSALLNASSHTPPLSSASLQGIKALVMMASDRTTAPIIYRRLDFGWCGSRHPFANCNQQLSCNRDVIVRSPTVGMLHALAANHSLQGRIIFPGAGYLEMARGAGAMALHGIYFLQPLAIEVGNLSVECAMSDNRFEVRSGASETIESATVHCSGEIDGVSGWWRIEHTPVRGCSHAADVDSLYDSFDVVGLQYGPGYRTMLKAWGGGSNALARLRARSTQEGTQVHPADLDDAVCTSGAAAVDGGGETRLPFAVDDAQLEGAQGKLWAVRFCSRR